MMSKSYRTLLLIPAAVVTMIKGAEAQVPGCSAYDNQVLAHYVPRMTDAMLEGNMDLFRALAEESNPKLSQQCQASLMQQQQQRQQYQRQPRSGRGSGVTDHGGGAYSTPDVYCGPSGCVPLR